MHLLLVRELRFGSFGACYLANVSERWYFASDRPTTWAHIDSVVCECTPHGDMVALIYCAGHVISNLTLKSIVAH
jgi:hypothetical protein